MQRRILGNTDLNLTTVGLGTWAIGGPWDWGWGAQDDTASIQTIHEALDLGINWIDTAPCYGLGHSERVVGQAIASRRDEVFVATKCGLVWDDPASGVAYERLTRGSVLKEAEDSLRRLDIDVIDLYQIHWPDPVEDIREAWEAMAGLVEAGKVRHIGVSNFSISQMDSLAEIHPVASLQPPYSMVERAFEKATEAYCQARQVGVVVYSPMQAGLLTGKFSASHFEGLAEDDWRRKSRHFREPAFSRNLGLVDSLRPIAAELQCSLAALAIAWTLRRSVVTAAIVGARRPDQIRQTASASTITLDPETVRAIQEILAPT
ncbi:MAG: aryl-alcohol dehydrogenase-like predicted oxidoreductase [Rhodothermales bacterium]|jgi:aryl-alcohol dehydrogenase-like predicted oxidoreductase